MPAAAEPREARERHAPLLAACEEQLDALDALDPSAPTVASTFIAIFDRVVDAIEVTDVSEFPPAASAILDRWAETFATFEVLIENQWVSDEELEGFTRGFIALARQLLIALYCQLGGRDLEPTTAAASLDPPHPKTTLVLRKYGQRVPSLSAPLVRARPRARRPATKRALGIRSGQDPGEGDDDPECESASPPAHRGGLA